MRTSWRSSVAVASILTFSASAGLVNVAASASATVQASPTRVVQPMRPDAPRVPPGAVRVHPAATGDYRIDALASGFKWSSSTVTYSFYSSAIYGGAYYGTETGVAEVSAGVKANVRQALAMYGSVLNLTFTEVAETPSTFGQIRVMVSSSPDYAYAYYPGGGNLSGDVHLNPGYDNSADTNGFQGPPSTHGYSALVHELGHALGLKHPFEDGTTLPSTEDNDAYTVMTYTWPYVDSEPATPMGYDLLTLHSLYGVPNRRPGNDTFQFTSHGLDQLNVGGTLQWPTPKSTRQIIADSAGTNTLDLSGLPASPSGYRIDTRPLGWLSRTSDYNASCLPSGVAPPPGLCFSKGAVIANSTVIAKVLSSPSDDTVYANNQANTFGGYAPGTATGNDRIIGGLTDDTLDLSGYSAASVTDSQVGNDRVLGLGANGSVTLVGYYASSTNRPTVSFSGGGGGGGAPSFSVTGGSTTEGSAGTSNVSFAVSISASPTEPVFVDYATTGGTATSGVDFLPASGTLTFTSGASQTVSVPVVGDTTSEGNESFTLVLSNARGSGSVTPTIATGTATGTIIDDDSTPSGISISSMSPQGTSVFRGQSVLITSTVVLTPSGAPAAGARVTFSLLKPGTARPVTRSTFTNASGVATWSWKVPRGARVTSLPYTAMATASYGGSVATSSTPATFYVIG